MALALESPWIGEPIALLSWTLPQIHMSCLHNIVRYNEPMLPYAGQAVKKKELQSGECTFLNDRYHLQIEERTIALRLRDSESRQRAVLALWSAALQMQTYHPEFC